MNSKYRMFRSYSLAVAATLAIGGILADNQVDFFVDEITSDGVGHVDPGYLYRSGGYPRTAKVQFEYSYWNFCRKMDDTTSSSAAIFGFWDSSKGGASGMRAHKTGEIVLWHGSTSIQNKAITGAGKEGRALAELDYLGRKATWSKGSAAKTFDCELSPPSDVVTVPYRLCALQNTGSGYMGIHSFKVFEQMEENGAVELVRSYVPCCAEGRPALYDTVSRTVVFPSSDGFSIPSTNSVTVAADGKLHVTEHTANQNLYALANGAELVFDGSATLNPVAGIVLPQSGCVKVSLERSRGRGRYELIDGLPADYDLSLFTIGALPEGFAGELIKDGVKLVLNLSRTVHMPDAIGAKLTSDAHGYIDTGYAFKSGSAAKTSKVEFDFYDTTRGKGALPGPTNTYSMCPVFGFWHGSNRSGARWNSSDRQLYGSGSEGWNVATSLNTGDQTIIFNYMTGGASWISPGKKQETSFLSPTSNGVDRYYIFNSFDGNGPFSSVSSVYDFKSFKIYETSDGGVTESLVRDYIPCIEGGKAGIYDRVTGATIHPTADTNGFVVSGVQWRVGTGDDCMYALEGETVTFPLEGSDGYLLVESLSGKVVGVGSGALVEFVVPAAAIEVVPSENGSLASGGKSQIASRVAYHNLGLERGAELEFSSSGCLYLSGLIELPAEGEVEISLVGVTGAGLHTLVCGVPADLDLSKFAVKNVTSGYVASLEVRGDCLVARVSDDPSGSPRFVNSIASDGFGWFDTEYCYKGADYPKTSRVFFDFENFNYGRKAEASTGFAAQFGFWKNAKEQSFVRSSGSQLIVYYATGTESLYNGSYTSFPKNSRAQIVFDYVAECAQITKNGVTETLVENMPASPYDASLSYYVCGGNGNNSPSYSHVYSFRIWEKSAEDGEESLAVDCVPCASGGKAALYDRARKMLLLPKHQEGVANAFTVTDWGVTTQRFECVTAVSSCPVSLPDFAPQTECTFSADGTVTVVEPVKELKISYYDAEGALRAETVKAYPPVASEHQVELGEAVRAVVSIVGYPKTFMQSFGQVMVESEAETLKRTVSRSEYELMIAADAKVVFGERVGAVTVESYNASGEMISSRQFASTIESGKVFNMDLDGAFYLVVRVRCWKGGTVVIVR